MSPFHVCFATSKHKLGLDSIGSFPSDHASKVRAFESFSGQDPSASGSSNRMKFRSMIRLDSKVSSCAAQHQLRKDMTGVCSSEN